MKVKGFINAVERIGLIIGICFVTAFIYDTISPMAAMLFALFLIGSILFLKSNGALA